MRSLICSAEGMWCEREWDLENHQGRSGGANRDMSCSGGGGLGNVRNGPVERRTRRRWWPKFGLRGEMLLAGVSIVEEGRKSLCDVRVHATTERE